MSLWYKDVSDKARNLTYRVEILNQEGELVGHNEGKASFKDALNTRTFSSFDHLPLPAVGDGQFHFLVKLKLRKDWVEVARVPFYVQCIRQPPV